MPFAKRICPKCHAYWLQKAGQRRFTICPTCRSPVYSAAQRDRYKRRRRALEIHREANALPESPTPPDLAKLMADLDRASERALNAALSLATKKPDR
jgi:uncharacterized Zn finger protein (UPF0148 family)